MARQSGQSIMVPKRVPKRLSNQFWTVSSLVAIKRRTECFGRIVKEVCRPRDGESESRGERPRLRKRTRRGKVSGGVSGRMESEKSGEGNMIIYEGKKEKARTEAKDGPR